MDEGRSPKLEESLAGKKAEDVGSAVAQFAIADPTTARLYANGFTLGVTNADAFIVLQQFGKPIGVLSISYTLAKSLAQKLGNLVQDWEQNTGQVLATTEMIEASFAEAQRKKIQDADTKDKR